MRSMLLAVAACLTITGCASNGTPLLGYAGTGNVTYLATSVSGAKCYNRIVADRAVDSICEDDLTLRYSPHRVYIQDSAYKVDEAAMPAYVLALFSTMKAPTTGAPVMASMFDRPEVYTRSAKSQ